MTSFEVKTLQSVHTQHRFLFTFKKKILLLFSIVVSSTLQHGSYYFFICIFVSLCSMITSFRHDHFWFLAYSKTILLLLLSFSKFHLTQSGQIKKKFIKVSLFHSIFIIFYINRNDHHSSIHSDQRSSTAHKLGWLLFFRFDKKYIYQYIEYKEQRNHKNTLNGFNWIYW